MTTHREAQVAPHAIETLAIPLDQVFCPCGVGSTLRPVLG